MNAVRTWIFSFALLTFCNEVLAYCISSESGCPQSGVGWPESTATFHSKGFGISNLTFDNAFSEAIAEWNGFSNFEYSEVTASADPCNGEPDSTRSWEFSSNYCGNAFGAQTLAIAVVWASSFTPSVDTIVDADIIFNTAYSWDVHNGPGTNIDFKRVAVHELGHALGLGHDNTSAVAIMDPIYNETVEVPQSDDRNGVIALYGNGLSGIGANCFPVKNVDGDIVIICY